MYVIETNRLTKYYGKTRGIENLDMRVKEGEVFGFIGPNGAGKSTTIRLLLDFIRPTSGKARVFGKDCFRASKEIKNQVGYLPSEVEYYDHMTARDLLTYSARYYRENLNSRIEELAERFELNLDRKFYHLSLGNKKKVAIIQAVLHKPRLLILDEPTSGLDPLMQQRFFEVLQEENQRGTTIFFSSHVLAEVQKVCERVAVIRDGNLIQVEEIEKLRKKQLKRVRITFPDGERIDNIPIPGAVNLSMQGNTLEFLFSGSMNQLTRHLAENNIEDLTIEEPSLEEIFMHYYETEREA